jgi:hypothetical protein
VKRFAVIALTTLYTLFLMWSSVDRTYSWAARQAEALSSASAGLSCSGANGFPNVGRPRLACQIRQVHRRIVQNPFVVEPPVLASWIVLSSEVLDQATDIPITGPDSLRLSGRAPPSFI